MRVGVGIGGGLAHPRAGGENALLKNGAYTGDGSSPRGRGKRTHARSLTLQPGLIPARAGKTDLVVQVGC